MEKDIEKVKKEYAEVTKELSDPGVVKDGQKMAELGKKQAELGKIVEKIGEYEALVKTMQENARMIETEEDEELRELATDENAKLSKRKGELETELGEFFSPSDPQDKKNEVIVEIRAGAGGDESSLFSAELLRAYTKFSEKNGWRVNIVNSHRTEIGGFKEVIFEIKGTGVYKKLKYESGVHRVQRIPETEKSGRIHTSTITVAVLPVAEEVELKIEPKDLRIDTFASSGPGGQSVNTTNSAVRITHLPTGAIVSCQDEKSQLKNKEKAMKVMRSRLLQLEQEKRAKEMGDARKSQIGTGDRSEKIRTYNFPQDRVTDHRIKKSWSNLAVILEGNIEDIVDSLQGEDAKLKMSKS